MVCKEDVVLWFKELPGYKRLDVMYNLLNMCLPFELRFLGTCLEELGKKDFIHLRDAELQANNPSVFPDLKCLNDKRTQSKIALYLALLYNNVCSKGFYKLLSSFELGDINSIVNMSPVDENPFEVLLLIYTLAVNHPVFTYTEKLNLTNILLKLTEEEKKWSSNSQSSSLNMYMKSHMQQGCNPCHMPQEQEIAVHHPPAANPSLGNEVHPKRPVVPPPGLMGPSPSEPPPTAFVHFGYGPPHQPPPTAPMNWVCQTTAGSTDVNSSPLISRQSSPTQCGSPNRCPSPPRGCPKGGFYSGSRSDKQQRPKQVVDAESTTNHQTNSQLDEISEESKDVQHLCTLLSQVSPSNGMTRPRHFGMQQHSSAAVAAAAAAAAQGQVIFPAPTGYTQQNCYTCIALPPTRIHPGPPTYYCNMRSMHLEETHPPVITPSSSGASDTSSGSHSPPDTPRGERWSPPAEDVKCEERIRHPLGRAKSHGSSLKSHPPDMMPRGPRPTAVNGGAAPTTVPYPFMAPPPQPAFRSFQTFGYMRPAFPFSPSGEMVYSTPPPPTFIPVYNHPPPLPPTKLTCYNCGSQSHLAPDCKEQAFEDVIKSGQYRIHYEPPDSK